MGKSRQSFAGCELLSRPVSTTCHPLGFPPAGRSRGSQNAQYECHAVDCFEGLLYIIPDKRSAIRACPSFGGIFRFPFPATIIRKIITKMKIPGQAGDDNLIYPCGNRCMLVYPPRGSTRFWKADKPMVESLFYTLKRSFSLILKRLLL